MSVSAKICTNFPLSNNKLSDKKIILDKIFVTKLNFCWFCPIFVPIYWTKLSSEKNVGNSDLRQFCSTNFCPIRKVAICSVKVDQTIIVKLIDHHSLPSLCRSWWVLLMWLMGYCQVLLLFWMRQMRYWT